MISVCEDHPEILQKIGAQARNLIESRYNRAGIIMFLEAFYQQLTALNRILYFCLPLPDHENFFLLPRVPYPTEKAINSVHSIRSNSSHVIMKLFFAPLTTAPCIKMHFRSE